MPETKLYHYIEILDIKKSFVFKAYLHYQKEFTYFSEELEKLLDLKILVLLKYNLKRLNCWNAS